jgi:ATP-dependent DNA helicase RecG
MTIPKLAWNIGVTERTIERNIRELRQNGLIRWVGGRKEGYWEVVGL